jgi:hypothetical protein
MRFIPLTRISGILAAGLVAVLLAAGPAGAEVRCPSGLRGVIGWLARAEEARVRDAIRLAAQGEAELALVRLDNGKQGSLQVWTAWALLQLGNQVGAFGGDACNRTPQRA